MSGEVLIEAVAKSLDMIKAEVDPDIQDVEKLQGFTDCDVIIYLSGVRVSGCSNTNQLHVDVFPDIVIEVKQFRFSHREII